VIFTVIGCFAGSLTKISAISRSFHTQRNWKIANDASAGHRERDHDAPEDGELGGAVHPAASIRSFGQRDEEVAEEEDRERQSERRVREPDAVELGVQVAVLAEELEQRHERRLHGHDHQRDDDQEGRVAEREARPRERVGGHCAERQRQERRGDRDVQAVQERVAHPPAWMTWL
jgi:hypothetical protein